MDKLRHIPIRRSLNRPILLMGGERILVMINITIICALIFGVGINKLTVITALLLATLGMWFLSRIAKSDPQMTQIYLRHIKYKEFYPAQSSVQAGTAYIKPSIPPVKLIG